MGETFADRLRAGRNRLNLSLAEMAAKAGISKTYLWELETTGPDAPVPSADVLARLARELGTTMDGLWLGTGPDPKQLLWQATQALQLIAYEAGAGREGG